MILTVTINPSVDKTYILKKFEPFAVNRSQRVMMNAGSKGINVSRVACILGQQTCALGFVGGTTGDVLLEKLQAEGINHQLVHAKNFQTRLNVKIMDVSRKKVTDLNELGDPVSEKDYNKLVELYKEEVPRCSVVALCGSLLPRMSKRTYYELTKIAAGYNKPVFVDCGGVVLRETLRAAPYCIKPNIHEFEDMLGKSGLSDEEIVSECKRIIETYGVKCVVVTLGSAGAVCVDGNQAFKIVPPNVVVTSTVGAGDAFLAGMCHAYLNGMDFAKQMILATSCANAKVTKEGNDVPSVIELMGYTDGCRIINF